ncbi:MAG: alpha/beta fold hydrolase [Alphaproteobacteria bacterium]|nr:alpha/beta fold hydrolase [Alphaproteobacteria bacterium]
MKRSITGLLLALVLPALLSACQEGGAERGASKASRYAPTNLPPVLPTGDFTAYIDGARGHVMAVNTAAKTPISEEEAAALGPFELRPQPKGKDCKGNAEAEYDRGVLLIHGLNDTAFSMWDLGARFAKACYLVRAILLPGHGTVPGDLLNVGPRAWRDAVAKAVWSFRGEADRLVIAGFDLGAVLALDAALDLAMPPEVELDGVVLLAPAFNYDPPSFAPAAVGPAGNALWGEVFEKHSSFRYHSIAKPSIAATERLGSALLDRQAPLHVPLFMVLSAEDAVTDAEAARDWFCGQSVTPRHLLWYSRYPEAPFPACSCTIQRRDSRANQSRVCVSIRSSSCTLPSSEEGGKRSLPTAETCRRNPFSSKNGDAGGAILDLAHIALLAAPSNPRYGATAKINDCLHYSWEQETPEGQVCSGRSNGDGARYLRYGETSGGNLENYILRRLTYNPDFDHMAERMIDFLRRSN